MAPRATTRYPFLESFRHQCDLYKHIHDRSVDLMNKGYTGFETSNLVKLPPELEKQRYNSGYPAA